jgi:hypothetical protein
MWEKICPEVYREPRLNFPPNTETVVAILARATDVMLSGSEASRFNAYGHDFSLQLCLSGIG